LPVAWSARLAAQVAETSDDLRLRAHRFKMRGKA
jgi:hypothetical protein